MLLIGTESLTRLANEVVASNDLLKRALPDASIAPAMVDTIMTAGMQ